MTKVSTDPIADMLTRIRNAILVSKNEIVLPHSKVKQAVADLLKNSGFINDVSVSELSIGKSLKLTLNDTNEPCRISVIKRLSTPGRRVYSRAKEVPTIKRGRGIVIVSTSKGLMTGDDAKKAGLGGELIASIY